MDPQNPLDPEHADDDHVVEDTKNADAENMDSGNENLQALFTAVEIHVARREQGSTPNEPPDICPKNATGMEGNDTMKTNQPWESHPADEPHPESANTFMEEEIPSKPPDVPCDNCDTKFGSVASMMRHARAVHGESNRSKPATCEECGDTFKRERNMRYHMYTAHRGNPIGSCDICHVNFVSKRSLSFHMARRHSDARTGKGVKKVSRRVSHVYSCTRCDYTSYREANVRRHYIAVHNGNTRPEFPCSNGCGHVARTKRAWVDHEIQCKRRPGNGSDHA